MMRTQSHNEAATRVRQSFYEHISAKNMTPLWEVLHGLVPREPQSPVSAALWRYDEVRGEVLTAGHLISAEEAERRVLVLENPALRGQSSITQTLYAGLQLVLPGELARAHRHTQSALRLVLEGEGAYTAVDGERHTMSRGDFIVTPSWTWHDHGNPSDEPVIWLDGLDIPLVRWLDAGFAEPGTSISQTELRAEGDTLARFGHNLVPVDCYSKPTDATRLFVYPFVQTKHALHGISSGNVDAHLGFKLRFVNPATGASPMPTIGTFAQLLPKAFETAAYKCSDSTVYVCLEGAGTARIGDCDFAFQENDLFVVPSWHALRLRAEREAILFSFSDRPVQQALGLWREARF